MSSGSFVERTTWVRVTVLLLVLVVVAAWGFGTLKRRWVRTRWTRPLEVGVVELATRSAKVPPGDRLDQGLVELEEALTRELHRYRGGPAPFKLTRLGPVRLDALPPLPPSGASAVERAQYTSSLQALAPTISEQTGQNLRRFDLLLYLRLEDDGDAEQRFVEGAGAAGGDFGMVQTSLNDRASVLTLVAIGHELLHCVGATDKYDAQGHAEGVGGLADPSLGLNQKQAEIMVGEIPTGAASGRLPTSLSEVAVGATTAAEIHWR